MNAEPREPHENTVPPRDPAAPGEPPPNVDSPAASTPLTPEEQMAAFEQALKETDWGHQPC